MERSIFKYFNFWITAILSIIGGMAIAWIDSQPNWDDSGITAAMLYVVSALAGLFSPRTPWLWGLFVGLWIPVAVINRTGDPRALLVLIISFGGAYSGSLIRKMIKSTRS